MYENYLAHYGVKGMKWGQRRRGVGRALNKLAKKRERVYKKHANVRKTQAKGYNTAPAYLKYQKAMQKYNKYATKFDKKYGNVVFGTKRTTAVSKKGKKVFEEQLTINGKAYTIFTKDYNMENYMT